MKVDMDRYNKSKEELGDAFYPNSGTILHGLQKDSKESIDKMVEDVERQ